VPGVTPTAATAGTTDTVVVALRPSDVAVIVALPTARALINPVDETLATFVLDDDQVTVRPNSVLPFASRAVAVRWAVEPTTIEAADDAIVTDATGVVAVVTVIVANADAPSLDARIVVVPAPTAVTSPVDDTVTTELFDDDHDACRLNNVVPSAAIVVAVNCAAVPAVIDAVAGVIATEATAGAPVVTVTRIEPDFPSAVALIRVEPAALPTTMPCAVTDATVSFAELHVTVRPVRAFPSASKSDAVSTCDCRTPNAMLLGAIETNATGPSTVSVALPERPSLVAVIVALPGPTAVTTPLVDTVATDADDVVHAIVRPVTTFPLASNVATVACCVAPATTVGFGSPTVTVDTGIGVTVIVADPVFVSLVAVIVAVPSATGVTTPVADTVAIEGSEVLQATVRPVSVVPFASRVVAVSVCVVVSGTDTVAGDTVTVATGAVVMVTVRVASFPSLDAVMSAVPSAPAVTSPVFETVATEGFDVVHTVVRSVSVAPRASRKVAVICCVPPRNTVATSGAMVTDATAAGTTVTASWPCFPADDAITSVWPTETPVTTPVALTVATAVDATDHETLSSRIARLF
jgi:hypothetical protein